MKTIGIYEERKMTKGNQTYKTPVRRPFTGNREVWFNTEEEAKQFIKANQRKLYNDRLCKGLYIYNTNDNFLIKVKTEEN